MKIEEADLRPKMMRRRKGLLLLNCVILFIGSCGAPLVMRLYFLHGGRRVWFSSWLETAGWPFILIPLFLTYTRRRTKEGSQAQLFSIKPRLFLASAVIGLITGLNDYFYASGAAKLPVSTSSLIIATQLAFTAAFAFLLVKQKFTAYSINAIFLLIIGAGMLALHTSSDRPAGESNEAYYLGFFMTIAAAALSGFTLPLVEFTYKKVKQTINYSLVLEMQMVIGLFATILCTVGMIVNKDFQAIPREAKEYELGEAKYYLVVVWSGITWQCFFVGLLGVIFCSSSLVSGVLTAALVPVTEILAVIFLHENFKAEKGVSLALSLWGFVSYFYGEIKDSKDPTPEAEQPQTARQEEHLVNT